MYKDEKLKLFNIQSIFENPIDFSINFTKLNEKYISEAFSLYSGNFSILSTGSFSRMELSPFSDIDIIFLSDEFDEQSNQNISQIIKFLWDSGIEISHTVRTFSDIDDFLKQDLNSYTQLFETRFLVGEQKYFHKLWEILKIQLTQEIITDITNKLIDDIQKKEKKFGNSPKYLEPNVKYSAGGLRDLHIAEWIYTIQNIESIDLGKENTQIENFINSLLKDDSYSKNELNKIFEKYKFLLSIRHILHIITNQLQDRLTFEMQEFLAKSIAQYNSNFQLFMNDYFEATTTQNRFLKTIIKKCQVYENDTLPEMLFTEIDTTFRLKNGIIYYDGSETLELFEIVKAFYLRGKYSARFSHGLRTQIIDASNLLKSSVSVSKFSAKYFKEIFNLEQNIGSTLRLMNEMGILRIFIPEWNGIIGKFQPGVYHSYTVDEHTIVAIAKLENLIHENSHLSKIFFGLKRKNLLFFATLLHDIGKGIDVESHEIIGAEITETIMYRLGFDDYSVKITKFLVRHHLTMEQTAFRRNLNDPYILDQFISIFPSRKSLDHLYLLTYADLSAVNPRVWTSWKADLLFELYDKVRILLEEKISPEDLIQSHHKKLTEKLIEKNDEEMEKHLHSIDDVNYLKDFSEEEISQHIKEINNDSKVSIIFKENDDYTNVTVITKDFNSLLSRLCGAFAINDANINNAKIFTREDGIVIDSFHITDFQTHKQLEISKYEKLKSDISAAVNNELVISREFKNTRSRWKRLEKKFFWKKDAVKVTFIEHHKYTIIDISANDKIGLLYKITSILNHLELDIFFAKISTQGDKVIDSFYILQRDRKKVLNLIKDAVAFEIEKEINKFLEDN